MAEEIIYNQMKNLQDKQAKIANEQKEVAKQTTRNKAQSVANIKRLQDIQGGTELSTQQVVKLIDNFNKTVTGRISGLTLAAEKSIGPIDEKLKNINELLSSNFEGDIDKGFELIEKLKKIGVDFEKFGEKTAKEIEKLIKLNDERKEAKKDEDRNRNEKKEELIKERDILREKGINTYVNIQEGRLELKTKKEEKLELKRIREEEKDIGKQRKELAAELKQLQKGDKIDKEKQEEIIEKQDKLNVREMLLQQDKEKANLRPTERTRGPLDATIGEAFRQIKTFGKEIKQLGVDLFKGFFKLPALLKGVALGLVSVVIVTIKFIVIALAIIAAVVVVVAIIKKVVEVFKKIINFVKESIEKLKNVFPFNKLFGKDDKGTVEEVVKVDKNDPNAVEDPNDIQDPLSNITALDNKNSEGLGGTDITSGETEDPMSNDKANLASGDIENYKDRILDKKLTSNMPGQQITTGDSNIQPNVLRPDINKMSKENLVSDQKVNNIVADNSFRNSIHTDNTQYISLDAKNFDPSYINLNHQRT